VLIDWFTVGAQALNFIILVWLLKRFLYGPILAAIDAREKSIAAAVAGAQATEASARGERDAYRRKQEEFAAEKKALWSHAVEEAKTRGARILDEARLAAEEMAAQRRESLRNEVREANHVLVERAREEVFAVARKALADLASADLEDKMAEVFIGRLGEMDAQAKSLLSESLRRPGPPPLVRSAFPLAPRQQEAISEAVRGTFASSALIRFESAPDQVAGIELSVQGRKIAWSISDYLSTLENLVAVLDERNPIPKEGRRIDPVLQSQGAPDGKRT
jgi:F-type H+-transporting ATPase subunit b